MLYFQFSYAVDLSTRGVDGEQQMLELYAQFRGWLNFAILVMQLAVSGRLYRRLRFANVFIRVADHLPVWVFLDGHRAEFADRDGNDRGGATRG